MIAVLMWIWVLAINLSFFAFFVLLTSHASWDLDSVESTQLTLVWYGVIVPGYLFQT